MRSANLLELNLSSLRRESNTVAGICIAIALPAGLTAPVLHIVFAGAETNATRVRRRGEDDGSFGEC